MQWLGDEELSLNWKREGLLAGGFYLSENPSGFKPDRMGNLAIGEFFSQSMFPIGLAEPIDLEDQDGS
tara:strand:+ start:234 stop:437 length:204 start_codon:yes stop_codon:yes gene_type:complete